jgi:serine/threonine protein kinase
MKSDPSLEVQNLEIAERWCASRGEGWKLLDVAGRGGTAPVFSVQSPDGLRALKLYDPEFSQGEMGRMSAIRVQKQVALGVHDCPYLVKIYDGGNFEDRLFLLMNRAPGVELEKRLKQIPRDGIRQIVDQIARACIFLRGNGLCHRDLKSANIFISDDFKLATLLDLSVTRDIHDPVGIGTDHGGELPVVATSRYSPPEYLFRLIAPSVDLWHALDVYQLGGLLHDLIMQEPLFESEYSRSKENRYRFAWIVATVDPTVASADVDPDLLLLARRALDKKWERRLALRLEDFLDDAHAQQRHGLVALGLFPARKASSPSPGIANKHRRVTDIAKNLETSLVAYLQRAGITATHQISVGESDFCKHIAFGWDSAKGRSDSALEDIRLTIKVDLRETADGQAFDLSAELRAKVDGRQRESTISLPSVIDGADAAQTLAAQAEGSLGALASALLRVGAGKE